MSSHHNQYIHSPVLFIPTIRPQQNQNQDRQQSNNLIGPLACIHPKLFGDIYFERDDGWKWFQHHSRSDPHLFSVAICSGCALHNICAAATSTTS